MPSKHLVVIQGPTAVGKTAISIAIARHFKCPVLSADSRQFFKEMSIGTAKPTAEEMGNVPHYFVGSLSIKEEYNAGKFEKDALTVLKQLFDKHNVVILVGGSGLYIDAVCNGFDSLPEADKKTRAKIEDLLTNKGLEALQSLLKELDPEYYEQADIQNPQRLCRALEVCLTSGKPYSSLRKKKNKKRDFKCIKIGLNTDRKTLYDKINQRVDQMIEEGLLEETKSLLPYKNNNALQTVGYKELFDYFDNKTDLTEAVERIKQNTRRFAKRQLTWLRKDTATQWFSPQQLNEILTYIEKEIASGI